MGLYATNGGLLCPRKLCCLEVMEEYERLLGLDNMTPGMVGLKTQVCTRQTRKLRTTQIRQRYLYLGISTTSFKALLAVLVIPFISRTPTRNLMPVLQIELPGTSTRYTCMYESVRRLVEAYRCQYRDTADTGINMCCCCLPGISVPKFNTRLYSTPYFASHPAMMHHSTFRWKKMPPEMPPDEALRVRGHTVCLGKQPGERAYLTGHTRTDVSAALRASDESQTPLRALAAYTALPPRTRLASTKPQRY